MSLQAVPHGQKVRFMTTMTPFPQGTKCWFLHVEKTDSSHQGLEYSLQSFTGRNISNQTHDQAEENNIESSTNASFKKLNLSSFRYTGTRTWCVFLKQHWIHVDVHFFNTKHDYRMGPEIIIRTSSWKIQPCPLNKDDSLPQILKCCFVRAHGELLLNQRNTLRRQWLILQDRKQCRGTSSVRLTKVWELDRQTIGKGLQIHQSTKDLSRDPVDKSDYSSKSGQSLYLTSSRQDLVLEDSGFELTAFLDVDHAEIIDTQKSTSRGIQFLGDKLVSWMSKKKNCMQCLQQ
ncbi:hypothetical protein Tco_1377128 [Tanacetum coccineum]